VKSNRPGHDFLIPGYGQTTRVSAKHYLPKQLLEHLAGLDKWLNHIANLRHALPHRIPLYTPPYVMQASDEASRKDFEARM
jgi:hypothetical protein